MRAGLSWVIRAPIDIAIDGDRAPAAQVLVARFSRRHGIIALQGRPLSAGASSSSWRGHQDVHHGAVRKSDPFPIGHRSSPLSLTRRRSYPAGEVTRFLSWVPFPLNNQLRRRDFRQLNPDACQQQAIPGRPPRLAVGFDLRDQISDAPALRLQHGPDGRVVAIPSSVQADHEGVVVVPMILAFTGRSLRTMSRCMASNSSLS